MTFDDGIVKIYSVENAAEEGNKPKEVLKYKASFYFSFESLGITRYYEALKANQLIESVIAIYQDKSILTNDIAVLEDKAQFRIAMVQHETDEDGIKITRLSLERLNNEYQYTD